MEACLELLLVYLSVFLKVNIFKSVDVRSHVYVVCLKGELRKTVFFRLRFYRHK